MTDSLICEECNTGNLPTVPEEDKFEETKCAYCQDGNAETLVEGKPSCVECKVNRKNKSPVHSILSEQIPNYPSSQASDRQGFNEDSSLRTPEPRDRNGVRTQTRINDGGATPARGSRTPVVSRGDLKPELNPRITGRLDVHVPLEQFKANRFLANYVENRIEESEQLYNTMRDGENSSAFHAKLDNKGGFIVIIDLVMGYKIGAYTWKGLRTNVKEVVDSQSGGVIIRGSTFELVSLSDNIICYEREGVRFNRSSALYLNFDDLTRSICSFIPESDAKNWPGKIEEINVYKL